MPPCLVRERAKSVIRETSPGLGQLVLSERRVEKTGVGSDMWAPSKIVIGLGRKTKEQGTIGPRGGDSSRAVSACMTDLDFVRGTGH